MTLSEMYQSFPLVGSVRCVKGRVCRGHMVPGLERKMCVVGT